jgi:hypothetical protein
VPTAFQHTACVLHRRGFVCAGISALANLIPGHARAQNPQQAGLVEDVKGEGFAEAGGARRMLERDKPVFFAERVGTGPASRLTIHLGGHTRVRLGERASPDRGARDALLRRAERRGVRGLRRARRRCGHGGRKSRDPAGRSRHRHPPSGRRTHAAAVMGRAAYPRGPRQRVLITFHNRNAARLLPTLR